jgi:hypothetical protein
MCVTIIYFPVPTLEDQVADQPVIRQNCWPGVASQELHPNEKPTPSPTGRVGSRQVSQELTAAQATQCGQQAATGEAVTQTPGSGRLPADAGKARPLEKPDRWKKLGWPLDRATFIKRLDDLRLIRNNVMHFNPEPLDPQAVVKLRHMLKLLRDFGGR